MHLKFWGLGVMCRLLCFGVFAGHENIVFHVTDDYDSDEREFFFTGSRAASAWLFSLSGQVWTDFLCRWELQDVP